MRFQNTNLLLAAVISSAALLPAQNKKAQLKLPIPDKYERATQVDDNGLKQWTEYRQLACPNCQGKKTIACFHCDGLILNKQGLECKIKKKTTRRVCAGLGYVPDPLEKVLYLQHQKRLLDLCVERAEFNDKAQAPKGK